jgi:acyl-CoA thioesterase YciA
MTHRSRFDDPAKIPDEIEGLIPTLRVIAMPADANPFGDIFGGWILSQMDLAGAAHAYKHLYTRVVTVGIEAMSFHKPVMIGDEVSFYTKIVKIGTTSITIKIESWAFRRSGSGYDKVTEGLYTYVQVDQDGSPLPIEDDKKQWQA